MREGGRDKRREERRRKERIRGQLRSDVTQGRCRGMDLCRAFLMRLPHNIKADCISQERAIVGVTAASRHDLRVIQQSPYS